MCEHCGCQAPTKFVTFHSNVGVLIMRFTTKISGNFCRPCIDKNFWSATLTSLFLGWFGVISFFVNWIFLAMNVANYLGARSLPVHWDDTVTAPL